MVFLQIVPPFVFLAFSVQAHRDSESSAHRTAGHLAAGANSAAEASARAAALATANAEVEREVNIRKLNRAIIEKCKEAQEAKEARKETKETVKTLADCVTGLAKIAKDTQNQRKASMEANREYAEDMYMAKKIMAYLDKKLTTREEEFQNHRREEQAQQSQLAELMKRIDSSSSSLQLQQTAVPQMFSSSLQLQQAAVPQIMPIQMQNVAAMFTPNGQSFGLPQTRIATPSQPSLLQLGVSQPWNGAAGASDLQAKLDREAKLLEEGDIAEDMGVF
mmetsp:Transcript_29635/g.47730  ORF Transcript_29635/g.47730 Transcript_29635/m.47730 type:complete len:277 (+) Transcript_29635:86-916(+)